MLQGSLTIAGAARPRLPGDRRRWSCAVELVARTRRAEGFALIGFEDGHTAALDLRERHARSVADDAPAVRIERALAADGVEIAMIAPAPKRAAGPARCVSALRRHPIDAERAARLVALDAANAVLAEGGCAARARGRPPKHSRSTSARSRCARRRWATSIRSRLRAESRVARALQLDGKADAAREHVERVLAIQRRVLGEDAFDTLRSRVAVGTMYWAAGRPQDGLPIVRAGLRAAAGALRPGASRNARRAGQSGADPVGPGPPGRGRSALRVPVARASSRSAASRTSARST